MAGLKFGTDGIRGAANTALSPELCLTLGRAAARLLGKPGEPFFVGRDTRLSGPMLQSALTAGLASAGANVVDLGVMPTPAIAFFAARHGAPAAVVSASHNLFADNGVKFFARGGQKLSDATEEELGAELGVQSEALTPVGAGVGGVSDAAERHAYVEHLVAACNDLQGMRVVIDCANGASSTFAPQLLRQLGSDLVVINDAPDGRNINQDCGSTHPEGLQAAVVQHGAVAGLAFDGDADRVLAVDEKGQLVDGDHLIAMLALDAHSTKDLVENTVVVTVMSNLGLRLALERAGIRIHETRVGDRYVLEALTKNGWSLGGEQSGHVIIPQHSTTGDGLLTGAKVLGLLSKSSRPLSEMAEAAMTRLPQVLQNVRVDDVARLQDAAAVWAEVSELEKRLGHEGRVLLRSSGTEPLVRVMVEAPSQDVADAACRHLCAVVERELAPS